ncbi:hypothetical protein [Streptomyces sp. Da 82-17]|uniref:hypothetical protein n=1 Tax=Streptomyces sp. Da 82-17 TaxID=3377116 RepID=UPI0038D3CC0C
MRTFSVTALVRSLNKPAKSVHVLVRAKNVEIAKNMARNKIQKANPSASVVIGRVR